MRTNGVENSASASHHALANGDADRSVATVFQDILGNVDHMVRGEVRLAKTEAVEDVLAAGKSALLPIVGFALAYLAIAFLLLGAFLALQVSVAPWAAAVVVGAGVAAVATVVIATGLERIRRKPRTHRVSLASRTERSQ